MNNVIVPQRPEVAPSRHADLTAHHRMAVHGLLGRRPELGGVVAMADLISDAVRWDA